MGVGVWLKKVNTSVFSRALWEVTNSQRMIVKAKVLGQKIRKVCFPLHVTLFLAFVSSGFY